MAAEWPEERLLHLVAVGAAPTSAARDADRGPDERAGVPAVLRPPVRCAAAWGRVPEGADVCGRGARSGRCRAVLEKCSSTITSLGSNLSSLNMGKQTPAPLQCSQYSSLETTPGPTRHHASTRAHTPLYDTHTVQFQHPLLGRRRRIRTRAARGRSASRPAPSSSEVRASTRADETAASRARTETAQPGHTHLVAAFGRAQRVEQLDLQQYRELRR